MPQVLDGTMDPGRVFDRELPPSDFAEAYRLMASPEALEVLIRPWAPPRRSSGRSLLTARPAPGPPGGP